MAVLDTIAIIEVIAKVIKAAVDLTPTVIKTVNDAKPFAEAIAKVVKGDVVTADELAQLEAHIADLSNQLQQPLPPEENGA